MATDDVNDSLVTNILNSTEDHSDSNGCQSNDKVYNEDYLGITEKGKFENRQSCIWS